MDIKGYIEIIYDYQIEKHYTAVTKTEFDNINPCQQIKVCLTCNNFHDQYIFGVQFTPAEVWLIVCPLWEDNHCLISVGYTQTHTIYTASWICSC